MAEKRLNFADKALGRKFDTTWGRQLTKATYAGITFVFEDGSKNVTRASSNHNVPFSDKYTVNDMGISDISHDVNIIFTGDEYILDRDEFEEVLIRYGGTANELKLPSSEAVLVKVKSWKIGKTSKFGGAETCSVSFTEVQEEKPVAVEKKDTKNEVLKKAKESENKAKDSMGTAKLEGQPQFVREDMFAGFKDFANKVAKYAESAKGIINEVSRFKADPLGYAVNAFTLFTETKTAFDSIKGAYFAVSGFVDWAFGDVSEAPTPVNNATRELNTNRELFETMINVGAVKTISEIAIDIPFTSRQEAVDIQRLTIEYFDRVLKKVEDLDNYDLYKSVVDLKRAFFEDSEANGASLPQVETVELKQEMPSLWLSYNQYSDASRASDIASRNGYTNPLFIEAGEVEVLTE